MTPAVQHEILLYSFGDFLCRQHVAFPSKIISNIICPVSSAGIRHETKKSQNSTFKEKNMTRKKDLSDFWEI
jgi:hypothetical protein